MSRFARSSYRIALAIGLVLALVGPSGTAAADETLTVTGSANPTAFFEVIMSVARHAGLFTAEHLNVVEHYTAGDMKEYGAGGAAGVGALLVANGKGDVATTTLEPVLQGYAKGLRLQSFFVRVPQYEWVLAVVDGSPIKTLADFKGATLGEMQAANPAEVVTTAFAGAGLRKSDYSYATIGHGDAAIAALTSGKVAGAVFPYMGLASYEVTGKVKFRYFWDPITEDIGDGSFAATPQTIQTKADQLERFSRAIVQASILIRENPRLAARWFLEDEGVPVTDAVLADETRLMVLGHEQLPASDPLSKTIGYLPPRSMAAYINYLVANGIMSAAMPSSAVLTNRFIAYANDFDHAAFIARVKKMH
jgi:NitT/TauT family transport system substrate-binding protein